MYRIGIGYDVHPLKRGRKLVLGGVEIKYGRGLFGHSDADALLHAIIDALLGAMGEKDIGFHFPASDPELKDASSLMMLRKVRDMMDHSGFGVVNVDSVIIADKPALAPHFDLMREKVASALGVKKSIISIKGKRTEGLGFEGRGEGIAAQAVALVQKRK